MHLYSLQCLLEEDTCGYQTQQLEFYQAERMLAMHMKLDHGRSKVSDKCDSCGRDTYTMNVEDVIDDKEIIKDEKKAISDELDEASCEIPDHSDKREADTAIRDTTDPNETSHHGDSDDVTSVIDDRDHQFEHFEKDQEAIEAENNAIEEIFKPVVTLHPS